MKRERVPPSTAKGATAVDTVRSTPKARKRHWCEVCGWAIEPGETYDRVITFDSGDVLTWKAHKSPCAIAAQRALLADYDDPYEGITADGVAEWASEYFETDELAAEIVRRLKVNDERRVAKVEAMLAAKGARHE